MRARGHGQVRRAWESGRSGSAGGARGSGVGGEGRVGGLNLSSSGGGRGRERERGDACGKAASAGGEGADAAAQRDELRCRVGLGSSDDHWRIAWGVWLQRTRMTATKLGSTTTTTTTPPRDLLLLSRLTLLLPLLPNIRFQHILSPTPAARGRDICHPSSRTSCPADSDAARTHTHMRPGRAAADPAPSLHFSFPSHHSTAHPPQFIGAFFASPPTTGSLLIVPGTPSSCAPTVSSDMLPSMHLHHTGPVQSRGPDAPHLPVAEVASSDDGALPWGVQRPVNDQRHAVPLMNARLAHIRTHRQRPPTVSVRTCLHPNAPAAVRG